MGSVNFERTFWCLQIDQKTSEIFIKIFALASKKTLNQKYVKGEGKNLNKNFVGFLVDLKTPKCPFEINWPHCVPNKNDLAQPLYVWQNLLATPSAWYYYYNLHKAPI